MGLTNRLTGAWSALTRSQFSFSQLDNLGSLMFNGTAYPIPTLNQTLRGKVEDIDGSFAGLVAQAYKANGVVFACMLARLQLFTEARFQYQRLEKGRPTTLWSDPSLEILEHPWPNGVTGDLLARAIQDADLAGNFFATRRHGAIRRLRPDWVTIVLGSDRDPEIEAGDIDAEVLGYIYHRGGRNSGRPVEVLLRSEVAHFAPIPDPVAAYRGMSWLTPVLREISADLAMTTHRALFFENGATPNMVVSLDKEILKTAFDGWVATFKEMEPRGWDAYKTLYLGAGATASVVGSDLQKVDFKNVQGAGETRIAAAAGVPPVIVGLSEGLQAATYSNYGQARRRFADNTMRPLWRNIAGSLETIVPPPSGSRLWYDDRDIQALAEDKKDLAEVHGLEAQQIRTLIEAGFKADAAIGAVQAGDMSLLAGNHTGLFSVQLQAPGSTKMPVGEAPGETPVGPGTGPQKPQIPAVVPKREAEMQMLRYAFERQQPPNVTVNFEPGAFAIAPPSVTFEEGAFRSGDTHIATPDVNVTVEPAQVNIHEGAVQTTVEPAQLSIERVEVIEHVATRTVIDRDETGKVIGDHEEPIE